MHILLMVFQITNHCNIASQIIKYNYLISMQPPNQINKYLQSVLLQVRMLELMMSQLQPHNIIIS